MTNFNKRICFNINVPVCPTYGTRFKDLCLSFFSPLSPATPLCCSEPASRCRTESGVHHCACPPWGNTIFLRVPRWVPALSQFCDKNERSDLVSYGCPCWICLILLVWQKAEFMWRVLFFFFFPRGEDTRRLSPLPSCMSFWSQWEYIIAETCECFQNLIRTGQWALRLFRKTWQPDMHICNVIPYSSFL